MLSNRRHFLSREAFGLSSLATAYLLQNESIGAAEAAPAKPPLVNQTFDLTPKTPPAAASADAMISIFMGGGPSHIDMFDPKPLMAKYDGKTFPRDDIDYDNAGGASKVVMASPFKFSPRGQSGIEMSELVPHIGSIADEICLVRSMNLPGVRNHVGGMHAMNSGRADGSRRPALGSWLTYALGTESQQLPAFVAMPTYSPPPGSPYWSSGFLPSIYQGTVVRNADPRILNLDPPKHLAGAAQRQNLQLLEQLNQRHLNRRPGELDLAARMASYELAAKMQLSATDALDIRQETEATHRMYGLGVDGVDQKFAESCLIARRLVERGVRFVQLWNYGWDHHGDINERLPKSCRGTDQPSAALVKDLKQRGMLDRTLVHWGGEMGRLPVIQVAKHDEKPGRDHNTDGFSMWLAGGGVKAGHVHGATDDFGHKAVTNPMTHIDYHHTLFKLFGLDAEHLFYHFNSRDLNITDGQSGHVIEELIA